MGQGSKDVQALSSIKPNVEVSLNAERGNLNLQFGQSESLSEPLVSDEWELGGRSLQFAQLGPNGALGLDHTKGRICVKVITGALATPKRSAFCEPRGLLNTVVEAPQIDAGADGALIAILTAPNSAPETIRSMDQLKFKGPQADALQWRTFHEQFGQFMDYFEGMDAYIGPGFHLLDERGAEITYINIWTAGKGVDLSTHNHGNDPMPQMPAFAEIHWTITNGTGKGGMYECDAPGAPERTRMPIATGEEHGPFFVFDPASGAPRLRENGAVEYPWHGWQAGTDDADGQAYDVVAAFETAPAYSKVDV
jgi:hypothetical protein